MPDDVGFATKPALATQMITAALDAGAPASWGAGDEVYGADPDLRRTLQDRQRARDRRQPAGHDPRWPHPHRRRGLREHPETILVSPVGRCRRPRGSWYSWSRTRIDFDEPGEHWLLVRRNDRTGELAYYGALSARPVRLQQLVTVAGQRRPVEESFQTSKEVTGLDQHQVRTWTSWHRWTVLVLLAHAFLVVVTAAVRAGRPRPTP